MKIAKEFDWEMGHRLRFHQGQCKNIHGHSYKMRVEIEGEPMPDGMVLDFYILFDIIHPVIDELDHSFLVHKDDFKVLDFLTELNSKHYVVGFESTVENLCSFFLEKLKARNFPSNVKKIKVRIYETEDSYAEDEILL